MNTQKLQVQTVDSDAKGLLRVGGIAALALAVAYLFTIPLYASAGAPPHSGAAWLTYLDGKTTVWWAILGLSILTDFLFVPVALALYFALKQISRDLLLVGLSFVLLFAVLDLAVTWPNYAALISLSGNYAAATSDAQRAAFVAAASYANATLSYSLPAYSILVISFGIFVVALVMLKGVFTKITAYLGLATGLLGIVSTIGAFFVSALGTVVILTSLLTIVWLLFTGYQLYRLSQR